MDRDLKNHPLRERGLYPHQVRLVEELSKAAPGSRFVFAYPIGSGTSLACIAALHELEQSNNQLRALVVAPPALLAQWQDQIKERTARPCTIVDNSSYRRMEARTAAEGNPWEVVNIAVASIDFVKREPVLSLLAKTHWDIVIIDEAHLSTSGSQRGALAEMLWESPAVDIAVALPVAHCSGELLSHLKKDGTKVLITKIEDIKDWRGEPLFQIEPQLFEPIPVELTEPEREFFEQFRNTIPQRLGKSFHASIYLQRAASSLAAIEQTLSRAIAISELSVDNGESETFSSFEKISPADKTLDREIANELLTLLENTSSDSKLKIALEIAGRTAKEPNSYLAVFCNFHDTALYLKSAFEDGAVRAETITGQVPREDRLEAAARIKSEGGVLILTSSAAEGMSLSYVCNCLHYDLPWSLASFHRRLGCVNRFGGSNQIKHMLLVDQWFEYNRLADMLVQSASPNSSESTFRWSLDDLFANVRCSTTS